MLLLFPRFYLFFLPFRKLSVKRVGWWRVEEEAMDGRREGVREGGRGAGGGGGGWGGGEGRKGKSLW